MVGTEDVELSVAEDRRVFRTERPTKEGTRGAVLVLGSFLGSVLPLPDGRRVALGRGGMVNEPDGPGACALFLVNRLEARGGANQRPERDELTLS